MDQAAMLRLRDRLQAIEDALVEADSDENHRHLCHLAHREGARAEAREASAPIMAFL
jgi:hypothetical protein